MLEFSFEQVGSTSDEVRRLALEHPGQVVLAHATEQTTGRGRRGHPWSSPRGGAWFSILWPMKKAPDVYQTVPLLAGLAVLQCVEQRVILPAVESGVLSRRPVMEIKWPNDVLLGGKKLAGILCERSIPAAGVSQDSTASLKAQGSNLIVGIGVNVNIEPAALGPDLRDSATGLRSLVGREIDVPDLIRQIAQRMGTLIQRLEAGGNPSTAMNEVAQRLAWIGRRVELIAPDRQTVGVCRGIDSIGQLLLEVDLGVSAFATGSLRLAER